MRGSGASTADGSHTHTQGVDKVKLKVWPEGLACGVS